MTGATLYDTNKFDINNSDVNVVGNFIAAAPVYINPDYINHRDYYAGWYKSQLSNKGGTYNSTYKVITDNWPAGWNINQFYCTFYYSDWTIIDYAYCAKASDNYEFNISNYLTQTQYNDLYYLTLNPADSDYNLLQTISDDIKLQLLS